MLQVRGAGLDSGPRVPRHRVPAVRPGVPDPAVLHLWLLAGDAAGV